MPSSALAPWICPLRKARVWNKLADAWLNVVMLDLSQL